MAHARLNPKRVKIHYSYPVEEVARMLGLHKNTVRGWLKEGLATIDDRRPAMVQGGVLRAFLEERRSARRCPCPPGAFYCLKCRAARPPAMGMVDFVPLSQASGNFRALCDECGSMMHRAGKWEAAASLMPNLEVRLVEREPRLWGSADPSLNCDFGQEP